MTSSCNDSDITFLFLTYPASCFEFLRYITFFHIHPMQKPHAYARHWADLYNLMCKEFDTPWILVTCDMHKSHIMCRKIFLGTFCYVCFWQFEDVQLRVFDWDTNFTYYFPNLWEADHGSTVNFTLLSKRMRLRYQANISGSVSSEGLKIMPVDLWTRNTTP